ncbi:hypothetical protein ccrud_00995 [Corynebacterium crudilactis]|uniref:Signal transduction histidine kinase subgroup 3 dimerisation and phosphoacceptor domain-containing protein n=2 Tax=Corynebacterium crudilactis TaxID=1652495 RepID=A0A172QQG6_9CORY|nr:hypothetical protein ccrud_00995 [Corynebacterium crudilactis]
MSKPAGEFSAMPQFLSTHRLVTFAGIAFLVFSFTEVLIGESWPVPQFLLLILAQFLVLIMGLMRSSTISTACLWTVCQILVAGLSVHGIPQAGSPFSLIVAQLAFVGLLIFHGHHVLAFITAGVLVWVGTIDLANGEFLPPHIQSALVLAVFFALPLALGHVLRLKGQQRTDLEERAKIQAKERRHELAIHLHRSVAKELTFAVMKAQELSDREDMSAELQAQLHDIENSARKALVQTHDLMKNLQAIDQLPYVSVSMHMPLEAVVNAVKADLEEIGFTLELDIDSFHELRSAANIEPLVTVLEEASSNIAKYADPAGPINIKMYSTDQEICLDISNTIQQIPGNTSSPISSGIGISHMRYAVESVGGTLHINNSSSQWSIHVRLLNNCANPAIRKNSLLRKRK